MGFPNGRAAAVGCLNAVRAFAGSRPGPASGVDGRIDPPDRSHGVDRGVRPSRESGDPNPRRPLGSRRRRCPRRRSGRGIARGRHRAAQHGSTTSPRAAPRRRPSGDPNPRRRGGRPAAAGTTAVLGGSIGRRDRRASPGRCRTEAIEGTPGGTTRPGWAFGACASPHARSRVRRRASRHDGGPGRVPGCGAHREACTGSTGGGVITSGGIPPRRTPDRPVRAGAARCSRAGSPPG